MKGLSKQYLTVFQRQKNEEPETSAPPASQCDATARCTEGPQRQSKAGSGAHGSCANDKLRARASPPSYATSIQVRFKRSTEPYDIQISTRNEWMWLFLCPILHHTIISPSDDQASFLHFYTTHRKSPQKAHVKHKIL